MQKVLKRYACERFEILNALPRVTIPITADFEYIYNDLLQLVTYYHLLLSVFWKVWYIILIDKFDSTVFQFVPKHISFRENK